MTTAKSAFALFFGNRGFFPASLQSAARAELAEVLHRLGHETIMLPENATKYGAVETPADGQVYANFLRHHAGKFNGVILCLPNFGDETGAVAALRDAGVPILIHAYPDEMDKLGPAVRRDAFCGKFSVMDVFVQYGIPFTTLRPHAAHPASKAFEQQLDYFDRVCRTVAALRRMVVGAIGARTTAFKTVRIDELALQKRGITVETIDFSLVLSRMFAMTAEDAAFKHKAVRLRKYTTWEGVPQRAFENLVRLGVVLDQLIAECKLDAIALRCWLEVQQQAGISPCVILSEINDRRVPAACEVDVANAIMMHALSRASGEVATCLDWNNNYGEEQDKCVLFHCGPVPQSMMRSKGTVTDHTMLANALGPGCSYGCNQGRITPGPMTFGSLLTRDGQIEAYLGQGRFTDDPLPKEFFGCAGVAEIAGLQGVLQTIGYAGHRHHVSVTPLGVAEPVHEAMTRYLGYKVMQL